MRALEWVRFSWDLARFTPDATRAHVPFRLRGAEPNDRGEIFKVVRTSFGLDSEWASYLGELERHVVRRLEADLLEKGLGCIVLLHGNRVIGCSAFDTSPEAGNHLLTGPCLLVEYHRRGLGTHLLQETLSALKDASLPGVYGITRAKGVSARHLYPKFGGVIESEPFAGGLGPAV